MNRPQCPHCGKEINPASIMGHMRSQKLTKKRRKEIAMMGVEAKKLKAVDKLLA